ncbi:MAG: 23S rRNA pseudouridine1911/1915/1917 synthase [Candidatus Krumholzibacteriia bacterium]|jgi:23S rRNA pseudouridine1911/1915/1917 synthase
MSNLPLLEFKVAQEHNDMRLDSFVATVQSTYSRSRIQSDLAAGCILVDGKPRPKGFRLKPEQMVSYQPVAQPEMSAVAQDLNLEIIHQDEHLAIVNKPVGLVVHPAVGHPDGTLVNGLLHHFKDLQAGGDPLRPGIVHRLDRDTSGLLAVALTDHAHRHLSEQLQEHKMGRTYHALSWGRWPEQSGKLTGEIGRHPRFRQKMAVVDRGGRTATTHFTVIDDFSFVQHCQVELETGRTHQIRVHFAFAGHPIVGDSMYGEDKRARGIHNLDRRAADRMVRDTKRQMLHAAKLRLIHPGTGQTVEYEAPMPADMELVLAGLRLSE